MFEGFSRHRFQVDDVEISCVRGGSGSPVLLLHGYPQNLYEWAALAPLLTDEHTVVCADLRGYGDSGKPDPLDDVSTYSFRRMAGDQVEVMRQLGFDSFQVVGHDRGGRVAHRMVLDWPGVVTSLTVLDLVPTTSLYLDTDRHLAQTYWQWYFLTQPAPLPERLILGDPDFYFEHCLVSNGGSALEHFDEQMLAEYQRCWRNPAMVHASCADYRAGRSIDLDTDVADQHVKVNCRVLALWAANGLLRQHFDIGAEWESRCPDLRSASVQGGHFFPEQQPELAAAELREFLHA